MQWTLATIRRRENGGKSRTVFFLVLEAPVTRRQAKNLVRKGDVGAAGFNIQTTLAVLCKQAFIEAVERAFISEQTECVYNGELFALPAQRWHTGPQPSPHMGCSQ